MPELRVDVLGSPLVTVDGRALAVDTRKAVALLAVLALARSAGRADVPRPELAALLWPEVDDTRARGALRRTLSVLLSATGGAVRADRTSVTLAEAVSDVVTFRALAVSDDREQLARAVGLVRGELLAGFALRDSPAFDEWVSRESDALRRELGEVLERLVVARLRHGELHQGLADGVRWLELDPLHEAAHRSVMRLLAWTGRRQDALDQYQRCVRVLGDELGVAPVHATTEVYEAIRAGTLPPPRRRAPVAHPSSSSPAASPPSGAPAPTPGPAALPLVGREAALATLHRSLGTGGVVLVTGESGVGRSRLVEEFAAGAGRVLLVRAHDGETALSFAPIADLLRAAVAAGTPLPEDRAAAVARLVPEVQPPGRPPAPPLSTPGARDLFYDAVVRVLADSGATAVVVEDVHAAGTASAEVLAYLLHRVDRLPCPLVLTWREPGLPERHPVRRALATGRLAERTTTVPLARLSRTEIADLAGPAGLDADAVWRDTAGLPLLVTAALHPGDSPAGALPMTIRDLLAARLTEVSEETAQVLATLAVLDGVADPGDLHEASGRTEAETADAVEEALRAGLVREEGSAVAFTHDVLRRVAYERLSLLRRRLLHHRAAETLAARRDADTLAAAVAAHFRLGGRDDAAADWAWRAAQRFQQLYAHAEALRELDLAASLGRDDADVALARGNALVALARYEDARAAFARALALGGPAARRAAIERRLADVAVRLGEWTRAAAGLDAALELADDDAGLTARLLADRAVVALRAGGAVGATGARPATAGDTGDTGEAERFVKAAEQSAPQPDPYVHNVLGIVAQAGGEPAAAIDEYQQALRLLARDADDALEAAVRNNLATAQAAAGLSSDAADTARAALALGERLGDRHRLAALHANLADRLHELGDGEASRAQLMHSAALFAEVDGEPLARPDVWTLTAW